MDKVNDTNELKIFSSALDRRAQFNSSLKNRRNEIMSVFVFFFKDVAAFKNKTTDKELSDSALAIERLLNPFIVYIKNNYEQLFFKEDVVTKELFGKLPSFKSIKKEIMKLAEEINDNGEVVTFDTKTPEKTAQMIILLRSHYFLKRILILSSATEGCLSNEFAMAVDASISFLYEVCSKFVLDEDGNVAFFMEGHIPLTTYLFEKGGATLLITRRKKGKTFTPIRVDVDIDAEGKYVFDPGLGFSHHNSCKKPNILSPATKDGLAKAKYMYVDGERTRYSMEVNVHEKIGLR